MDAFKVAALRAEGQGEPRSRWVPLDGAANVRDLGGYPTLDGGVVRTGQLFRGDSPHRLSESDGQMMDELAIRTRIDLRRTDEIARLGSGLWGGAVRVSLHASLEVKRDVSDVASTSLERLYRSYIEDSWFELASSVRFLAERWHRPSFFHCYAGKDRTGVLAALVLGTLGVPEEVIVADYVRTESVKKKFVSLAYEELVSSLSPGVTASMDSPILAASAETMENFLFWLNEKYGGPRRYLLDAGVPRDVLTQLRTDLVIFDPDDWTDVTQKEAMNERESTVTIF